MWVRTGEIDGSNVVGSCIPEFIVSGHNKRISGSGNNLSGYIAGDNLCDNMGINGYPRQANIVLQR